MKILLKKAWYKIIPYKIPDTYSFNLGYVFHTEMVFDDNIFKNLLFFCKEYEIITGKKPICTVMSGVNPKVIDGMQKNNCNSNQLADRYKELSKLATIGYHGHFYLNTTHFKRHESEIRSNNFSKLHVSHQVEKDLEWFYKNNLQHNGIYAGGWWFTNKDLIEILIKLGFKYDFSFSKHIYFRNQFSHDLMLRNSIKTGQPFELNIKNTGSIKEIQNLIGAPATPFYDDYKRHTLNILDKNQPTVTGVLNSHDYDLDATNTLHLFNFLSKEKNVNFFDAKDILETGLKLDYKMVSI
ncbi:hypothetical protein TH61_11465 [Rufibacter sp. DG15C]|uniref:hypothetical protein n=1 Tax=Rufibacter sp. DG15C TaxID=1379909 RepID=UPI00078DC3A0|nr:hypothetical protein [Rufibacter sp. DG15C]AMM51673.1 hypothetical protein TH61_11465 [Rufibacter sp. DG15C]